MIPDLPRLEFLPIDSIIFHEHHDEQRTGPLIDRIRESGLFRNPPIVAPLNDNTGRYMVLDGANRIAALREMGFPDVLVQITQPGDAGLELENWNHVIWELDSKELFGGVRDIPGIDLVPGEGEDIQPDLMGDCGLALLQLPSGITFSACTAAEELVRRVALLNAIVDSYRRRATLDRTSFRHIRYLVGKYPNLSGMVVFPNFLIEDVLRLAGSGFLLPSGITRFTVSPRALHINYPLYELAADRPLAEKNAALQDWVQQRLASKGIRYYAEATFLYDE
jgi:hypothetical protein